MPSFMMILEMCHVSVSLDVKGTQESYDKLQLVDCLGENLSTLSSATLTYIKITNTEYAMHVKKGRKLLAKVSKKSFNFFNRNRHDKISDTRKMEATYALKDPKLLKADIEYPTFGTF